MLDPINLDKSLISVYGYLLKSPTLLDPIAYNLFMAPSFEIDYNTCLMKKDVIKQTFNVFSKVKLGLYITTALTTLSILALSYKVLKNKNKKRAILSLVGSSVLFVLCRQMFYRIVQDLNSKMLFAECKLTKNCLKVIPSFYLTNF